MNYGSQVVHEASGQHSLPEIGNVKTQLQRHRMQIPTVASFWKYLKALLEAI